ncbi:MAG: type II toxin-antitoxin system Phd/YefM family antitoxin [Vicinamibacteria bacterium]
MRASVGSRELKTRLGTYLRRARAGHVVVVTDRGQPVAELRPLGQGDAEESGLARLAARGTLTPRRRGLTSFVPVRRSGPSLAEAVSEDRKDRF